MSRPRHLNQKPEGATMTPSEIKREWDKLSKHSSKNTQAFIDAGRGHERPSDYQHKTDPLSAEAHEISEKRRYLEQEAMRYAGPDWHRVVKLGSKW